MSASRPIDRPRVSVVIPTHDRLPCLLQCLDALAGQRFPLDQVEVIVVADGCTDGTEAALSVATYPFAFQVLAQPGAGAAAARNRGADAARGAVLLFLDDDVIASPGLVEAHVAIHEAHPDAVAVGPYLPSPPDERDLFQASYYQWWRATFDRISDPRIKPGYKDVLSGNLSITSQTFHEVDGFDPAFSGYGSEDYEFGVRLFERGIRMVYAAGAMALHLHTSDVARALRGARAEGIADVLFATLHPSILPTLRLAHVPTPIDWLVFRTPLVGRATSKIGRGFLSVSDRLGLPRLWKACYGHLVTYWYWRGVADRLASSVEMRRQLGGLGVPALGAPR